MEFTFSPDQEMFSKLAAKIFAEQVNDKNLKEAETTWMHQRAFDELARAGLLGIAISTDHGGAGMGLIELCMLLEQQGRAVVPLPLFSSLVLGALPISEFGSEAQKSLYLPRVATGECVLSAALVEPDSGDPGRPMTRAEPSGNGYVLDGVKTAVSAADRAEKILVPARLGTQTVVFLISPKAPGITLARQTATSNEPLHEMTLTNVQVSAGDVLGDVNRGVEIAAWMVARARVALCAMELGVAQRQLEMISDYSLRRQQFGKPIALFQAVGQRAADAYIDLQAMRLSTWQAVWRLSENLPAEREVLYAKFWAADGGYRIATAAQHIHGGMGFDRAYPLHRYFLWAKQIELLLGGASEQLAEIGASIRR